MAKSILLSLFIFLTATLTSCKLTRFVVYNFSDITDYEISPRQEISNGPAYFLFTQASQQSSFDNFKVDGGGIPFDDSLEKNETVAFLVIQDDSVKYEKYFDDDSESSIV